MRRPFEDDRDPIEPEDRGPWARDRRPIEGVHPQVLACPCCHGPAQGVAWSATQAGWFCGGCGTVIQLRMPPAWRAVMQARQAEAA
jgi:hypothetical protein